MSEVEAGTAVDARSVSKAYGEVTVLDELSMTVGTTEKVSLIGPSGSGKTTILRMLMGLERPDAGTVAVNGVNMWHQVRDGRARPANEHHLRRARRGVGMVFQQFNLFPHMNAQQNVAEPLIRVAGTDKATALSEAAELLALVGLSAQLAHKPSQLSGGQQQRVAIARALALKPKLMLFDEVTSALDPELVGEVLHVVEDIAVQREVAMVVVTHEIEFALHISDRVLMFDKGRVVEDGPPQDVLRAPQNERTQRFLSRLLDRG